MNEIYQSDSDEEVACAAAAYMLLSGEFLCRKTAKRKRRCWMVPLHKSRTRYGAGDILSDLRIERFGKFGNCCLLSATDFECLLRRVGPFIARQDTNMRKSISVQERLAVTLQFFATGDSYASLSCLFKFSKQTVSRCVDEVCRAIIQELQEEVKLPKDEDEWRTVAQGYENEWNFLHCLGAIGGRHVVVQCPMKMSTELVNYKGTFSVVLLAAVDAHHCFTFVDIMSQGQIHDEGVLNPSCLFSETQMEKLKLPPDRHLPSLNAILPYVFLGDSAFTSSRRVLLPYPGVPEEGSAQSVFNYRLTRARGVVDNVFGAMASVFRVLRKPMVLEPDKVSSVTLACVLLHNLMRRSPSSAPFYTPPGTFDADVNGNFVPGLWRSDQSEVMSFLPIQRAASRPQLTGQDVRNSFAEYFTTSGEVPWQNNPC